MIISLLTIIIIIIVIICIPAGGGVGNLRHLITLLTRTTFPAPHKRVSGTDLNMMWLDL